MKNRFWKYACLGLLVPAAATGQTLLPAQDSYVVPANGANFGSAANISVGSNSSQGLIQFDLSGLPAGTTAGQVQKALFTIFANHITSPGSVMILEANGPWTETGVTGTNGPSAGAVVAASVPVTVQGQFITIDATTAVQDWLNSPGNNAGFLIEAIEG